MAQPLPQMLASAQRVPRLPLTLLYGSNFPRRQSQLVFVALARTRGETFSALDLGGLFFHKSLQEKGQC